MNCLANYSWICIHLLEYRRLYQQTPKLTILRYITHNKSLLAVKLTSLTLNNDEDVSSIIYVKDH